MKKKNIYSNYLVDILITLIFIACVVCIIWAMICFLRWSWGSSSYRFEVKPENLIYKNWCIKNNGFYKPETTLSSETCEFPK